ncbi:MAG: four helix bundle protein [Bacteroidales bacterium]
MKESIVGGKAYYYALSIIPLYQKMLQQKEYIISKQLLRSSTSIGANIEEATAGSSRKDFCAKMAIASKEARESRFWLRLISDSNLIGDFDFQELLKEIDEIIKMLTKIVKTTQTQEIKQ